MFDPDCTRSGRLKAGAKPLDSHFDAFDLPSEQIGHVVSEASSVGGGVERESVIVPASSEGQDVQPLEAQIDQGHVTTDSSNSSGEEFEAWPPVVGHYTVDIPADKRMWRNSNTKMFHLSHEDHVRVLLCGRRITGSFKEHSGTIRFDAAKCRQCFRQKDA